MKNELQGTIDRFLGGDPVAGNLALKELIAAGDVAEEALFTGWIDFPKTVQSRRRWLRYVASRQATVRERLLDRMKNQSQDTHNVAFLFAGLAKEYSVTDPLFRLLERAFKELFSDVDSVRNLFLARGYAGGDAALLWHFLKDRHFAWEKLLTHAFRAACASFARVNGGDDWAIEQFITHEWGDWEPKKIGNSTDSQIGHESVGGSEMWMQANDAFVTWRRGEVADVILRDWSKHQHWRVRDFGAQILASLGFGRSLIPVVEWLEREKLATVRASLLHALERTERKAGADALLEHYSATNGEGSAYVARSAWRAGDKQKAIAALREIAGAEGRSAEAVVSLARLEQRHPRLEAMLDSTDQYSRLNAALAVSYLGDIASVPQLTGMLNEASAPVERVYLSSALAILGGANGAEGLNRELITMASAPKFDDRMDLFFMHRYLQVGVLDGLRAEGPSSAELLLAWQQELEPLEPFPVPIIRDDSAPAKSQTSGTREAGFPASDAKPVQTQVPHADATKLAPTGSLRKVRIFLASSSELQGDRDEFDLYFRQRNDSLLNKNVYLQIVGWDNFLDSMSETRLQDEYNQAIRECEVFVSLFFTKTGKFTEEEFDAAHRQFKASGKPLIYTFFKNADIKTGSAREDDLTSLWAFQKKLKSMGHFQTNYDNTEHLKRLFRDQIDRILEKLNLVAP